MFFWGNDFYFMNVDYLHTSASENDVAKLCSQPKSNFFSDSHFSSLL